MTFSSRPLDSFAFIIVLSIAWNGLCPAHIDWKGCALPSSYGKSFLNRRRTKVMKKAPVARLPWIVKLAVVLTFFNSWVLFEETVVDRHGLWRYMPFYRVGLFCAWDAAALLIIVPGVWYAFRRLRQRRASLTDNTACFLKLKRCLLCT
jgi:hypothetical protein